jgi:hypothetical protein
VVNDFENEDAPTELDESNATLEEPDVALIDLEVTLEEPDVALGDPEVALRDPEVLLKESVPELAEIDAELRLDCEATLLKMVVTEDEDEDEDEDGVDWIPAPLETLILIEAVELSIEEGMVDDGAALLADDNWLEL